MTSPGPAPRATASSSRRRRSDEYMYIMKGCLALPSGRQQVDAFTPDQASSPRRSTAGNSASRWASAAARWRPCDAACVGPRGLKMFADWTDRIAKGEVPEAPPRPTGVERNVVVTLWGWTDNIRHGPRRGVNRQAQSASERAMAPSSAPRSPTTTSPSSTRREHLGADAHPDADPAREDDRLLRPGRRQDITDRRSGSLQPGEQRTTR